MGIHNCPFIRTSMIVNVSKKLKIDQDFSKLADCYSSNSRSRSRGIGGVITNLLICLNMIYCFTIPVIHA